MQLVFICAGRGTRLGARKPEGAPKSMVQLRGEPLIGRLMRRLSALHKGPIPPIFVVAAGDDHVARFVLSRWPAALIVRQPAPDGVASAILCALPHLSGPALIVLGDLVLEGRLLEPWPPAPAVAVWPGGGPESVRLNYGVRLRGAAVADVIEKPDETGDMICGLGIYLLMPEVIELFASAPVNAATREREVTEAIRFAIGRGVPFSTLRFEGRYLNINTPEDLDAAEAVVTEGS